MTSLLKRERETHRQSDSADTHTYECMRADTKVHMCACVWCPYTCTHRQGQSESEERRKKMLVGREKKRGERRERGEREERERRETEERDREREKERGGQQVSVYTHTC